MAQKPTAKQPEYDIAKIFEEIQGDSDRAAAITAAAYFDRILRLALLARLVPLDEKKITQLFDDREGVFTTTYSMALVGYAVGLYGPKTLKDLDLIRQIRNCFAHFPAVSTFNHDEVRWRCKKLHTAKNVKSTKGPRDPNPGTPRANYLDSLLEIGARLLRSGIRTRDHQLTVLDNGLL